MNRLFLILSVVFCTASFKAQTDVYVKLKKAIQASHPEIMLENKIIAFNIWSVSEQESREANKSFEKSYKVFEVARLKGGSKGIVVVLVNTDNLSIQATIQLGKDGVSKSISLKGEDLTEITDTHNTNMIFDSNGNELYRNLPSGTIFRTFQNLITR